MRNVRLPGAQRQWWRGQITPQRTCVYYNAGTAKPTSRPPAADHRPAHAWPCHATPEPGRQLRESTVAAAPPPAAAVLPQHRSSACRGHAPKPRSTRSAPPAPGPPGYSPPRTAVPRSPHPPSSADGPRSPESEGYPAVRSPAAHPNRCGSVGLCGQQCIPLPCCPQHDECEVDRGASCARTLSSKAITASRGNEERWSRKAAGK